MRALWEATFNEIPDLLAHGVHHGCYCGCARGCGPQRFGRWLAGWLQIKIEINVGTAVVGLWDVGGGGLHVQVLIQVQGL